MSSSQKIVLGLKSCLFYLKSESFIFTALFILGIVMGLLTYNGGFTLVEVLLVPAVIIVISSIILIVKSDLITVLGLVMGGVLISIGSFGAQLFLWLYGMVF